MSIFNKRNVDHFVSNGAKNKPEWYITTFDTLSSIAVGNGDKDHLDKIDKIVRSNIDKKDYNSFLNPFNFKEDRNKRLPGEVRNFDIIMSNVRKFIGENLQEHRALALGMNQLADALFHLFHRMSCEIFYLILTTDSFSRCMMLCHYHFFASLTLL